MSKKLLFVDDDPMVLDGLRRSLHGMRRDWQMNFVSSAAAALEALESEPYDAVVSDMRMPLMDGAALLEAVKLRYPDVVRMILSGQSSREAVYRSIAPAHQFLAKPCNPKELTGRLSQAFSMRDLLASQSLKTIISGMRSLPSLPALYSELTAALQKDEPSLGEIAGIISKDVSMALKILQLANSAFVGASGRVSSLVQALSLIGTETVRTLVLSVHVFSHFDANSRVAARMPALWDHSVSVSSLAQRIANCENCPKALVEESFTAGLLHDIGKLVLLAEMPNEYQQIFETAAPSQREREQQALGCTHAEIGAYLMSIWGIPLSLVQAVAFHHHPLDAGDTQFSSLTAVHAAGALLATNHDLELDLRYLDSLGLRQREPIWLGLVASSVPSQQADTVPTS
jgi:putative nucleotidyltransferase with HDIG domain